MGFVFKDERQRTKNWLGGHHEYDKELKIEGIV